MFFGFIYIYKIHPTQAPAFRINLAVIWDIPIWINYSSSMVMRLHLHWRTSSSAASGFLSFLPPPTASPRVYLSKEACRGMVAYSHWNWVCSTTSSRPTTRVLARISFLFPVRLITTKFRRTKPWSPIVKIASSQKVRSIHCYRFWNFSRPL